jgi:dCMP deaminase
MYKLGLGKWDYGYYFMAESYARMWSKDPSTKVGAVIVNDDRVPVGWGYNGHPRGIADTHERYHDRETKYKYVVHAESNAIDNAVGSVRGATMYCTLFPCAEAKCAHRIIQAGIKRVIAPDYHTDDGRADRWIDSHNFSHSLLLEAGIEVILLLPHHIDMWREIFELGNQHQATVAYE